MKVSTYIGIVGVLVLFAACVRRSPPPAVIAVYATPPPAAASAESASTAQAPADPGAAPVPPPDPAPAPPPTPTTEPQPETTGSAATATLVETPTRDDVLRAVHGVEPQTRACGRGHPQTIMVQLTFSSSGQLTEAEPQESARGSAEASCLVTALGAARTAPFRAPSLRMWVPFSLE